MVWCILILLRFGIRNRDAFADTKLPGLVGAMSNKMMNKAAGTSHYNKSKRLLRSEIRQPCLCVANIQVF